MGVGYPPLFLYLVKYVYTFSVVGDCSAESRLRSESAAEWSEGILRLFLKLSENMYRN